MSSSEPFPCTTLLPWSNKIYLFFLLPLFPTSLFFTSFYWHIYSSFTHFPSLIFLRTTSSPFPMAWHTWCSWCGSCNLIQFLSYALSCSCIQRISDYSMSSHLLSLVCTVLMQNAFLSSFPGQQLIILPKLVQRDLRRLLWALLPAAV